MNREEYLELILVCVVLACAAYSTNYIVHEKYGLPFHSDEWDHLAIGKELVKTGSVESIKKINPYIGVPYAEYWVNQESGFHLFTALLLMFTGLTVTKFGVLMPTILSFILALNAFVFIRHISKSMFAGVISAIYAITIKSNVTFLGPWFYVPSNLGLAYAPFFLYIFLRTLRKKKTINPFDLIFGLVFAVIGLSHPPSVTALIPVFCVYLAFNRKKIVQNRNKILLAAVGGVVLATAMLFVMHIPLRVLSDPLSFVYRYLVFTGQDDEVKIMYSYPAYLGWGVILLAVVGVYSTISSPNKEEWILPIAVLSLLPLAVQFYHTGSVFLSPYRRIFFYNAEILLLTAGLGLFSLYHEAFYLLKASHMKFKIKILLYVPIVALLFYVLIAQVNSTFKYSDKLYHVIEENDVPALLWLNENTPEDAVVMAPVGISQAITPIAERMVVGKTRTFLRVPAERVDDANAFFNVGCEKKEDIALKYGVSYVFGPKTSCGFLSLVHSSGRNFIYKVELN